MVRIGLRALDRLAEERDWAVNPCACHWLQVAAVSFCDTLLRRLALREHALFPEDSTQTKNLQILFDYCIKRTIITVCLSHVHSTRRYTQIHALTNRPESICAHVCVCVHSGVLQTLRRTLQLCSPTSAAPCSHHVRVGSTCAHTWGGVKLLFEWAFYSDKARARSALAAACLRTVVCLRKPVSHAAQVLSYLFVWPLRAAAACT